MTDTLEAFRASWDSAQGNDFASLMSRRSLEALASQREDLNEVLTELKKPLQESLDLHLKGSGVQDHSTSTFSLGIFMAQIAEAVKQIAKGVSGHKKWSYNLLSVAPAPGSVRLYFEVPPVKDHQATLTNVQPPTYDAQALRTMANLLVQAEGGEETLAAAAQSLPVPARKAMKQVAQTVMDSHWKFDGKLEVRGRPTVALELSEAGAQRLFHAANETDLESTPVLFSGECDGWTWSTGIMRFLPVGHRPFSASVPSALQPQVAALVGRPGTKVEASFLMTRLTATGTRRSVRSSYQLQTIREA